MRIISGSLKGRIIPFNVKKYNNADITAQRLKEALFSILGGRLDGTSFLDLYSCSGQIGFEAVSRGCAPVVFNEKNRARFLFIKKLAKDFEVEQSCRILNADAFRCMDILAGEKETFDYIFLDPPYSKTRGNVELYEKLIAYVEDRGILKKNGIVILQHFIHNIFNSSYGGLELKISRKYGTNGIVLFAFREGTANR